jgi:hypothetical protein
MKMMMKRRGRRRKGKRKAVIKKEKEDGQGKAIGKTKQNRSFIFSILDFHFPPPSSFFSSVVSNLFSACICASLRVRLYSKF